MQVFEAHPKTPAAPKPSTPHTRLHAFVGRWRADGRSRVSPFDPRPPLSDEALPARMYGTHDFAMLPGEFFLEQRGDVRVGNVQLRSTWLIGWDERADAYRMWLFDDGGNQCEYTATVSGHIWTIEGREQRAELAFSHEGTRLRQVWSVLVDGHWEPLCDVESVREG